MIEGLTFRQTAVIGLGHMLVSYFMIGGTGWCAFVGLFDFAFWSLVILALLFSPVQNWEWEWDMNIPTKEKKSMSYDERIEKLKKEVSAEK